MAGSGGVRAGKAFIEIGTKDSYKIGLINAQKALSAFGSAVRKIGLGLTALGVGLATPLLAAAKSFADAGSALNDMSERTGIAVDVLQELSFAARQSGANVDQLETGIGHLSKMIVQFANGGKEASDAFAAIHVSLSQLRSLRPDEQFALVAKQLSAVENATVRAALAQQLYGKGGRVLLPMLKDLPQLRQEWQKLGIAMSKKDVLAADKLGDSWDALKDVLHSVVNVIGAALAPSLTDIIKRLQSAIATVGAFLNRNRELVVSALRVAAGITAIGASLVVTGTALIGLSYAVGALSKAWSLFSGAIGFSKALLVTLLNPIGLVSAAVIGLGAYLIYTSVAGSDALGFLGKKFKEVSGIAIEAWQGISDALASGDLALAGKIAIQGLTVAWLQGTKEIRQAWTEIVFGMEALWVGFSSTVSSIWADLFTSIGNGLDKFFGWVAKRFNDVHGLIDDSFDSVAANKIVDAGTKDQISDRNAAHAERQQEILAEKQKALDAIGDQISKKEADANKEIKAAQEELKALRQKAKDAKDSLQSTDKPQFQVPQLGELSPFTKQITSQGGFNVSAAFGFAGGAFTNLEKIGSDQLKVMKDIRDNTEDGGTFL